MRGFLDRMRANLSPFGMVRGATFVNFPDDSLKADAHEKSYYGNNYQELRRIKKIWDKDNFFNRSQGIQLPGTSAPQTVSMDMEDNDGLLEDLLAARAFVVNEEDLTDALAEQQWESSRPSTPTDFYGSGALPTLVYR
ncbi:uncharacterized protein Z519_11804 [Cladophialophora bantiana CBS 173.52]|uniref:Berberine/berberine-like domain-containing protein n=1 Tax=Cladophialophora bantiana (strain ATCC 10958 / CBS 173.52 / CDC B-1940 / NIH 8579) TaxID=1442370 RepID=A0A0D2EBL4_CLAB1|nr:uncharacterized protein Z519_11804 [Cladophialophora bantiana CBS 173.52]KIW87481.1 hypothetical protein Z519_11804 [Cladophialophora bantiana CBS 173.52]